MALVGTRLDRHDGQGDQVGPWQGRQEATVWKLKVAGRAKEIPTAELLTAPAKKNFVLQIAC